MSQHKNTHENPREENEKTRQIRENKKKRPKNLFQQEEEKREKTEWHRVVIFNENLGRTAEQYLRKGSTVYIEGQLQTRKWTDQQGQEKYTTEVVLQRYRGGLTMLGGRADSLATPGFSDTNSDTGFNSSPQSEGSSNDGSRSISGIDDLDDEIPF